MFKNLIGVLLLMVTTPSAFSQSEVFPGSIVILQIEEIHDNGNYFEHTYKINEVLHGSKKLAGKTFRSPVASYQMYTGIPYLGDTCKVKDTYITTVGLNRDESISHAIPRGYNDIQMSFRKNSPEGVKMMKEFAKFLNAFLVGEDEAREELVEANEGSDNLSIQRFIKTQVNSPFGVEDPFNL